MGSYTGHIFIGKTDDFHGGIIPQFTLQLWENSTPRLILSRVAGKGKRGKLALWVPTVDHMIDDVMLMIGLYVEQNETLVKYFQRVIPQHVSMEDLEIWRHVTDEIRQSLYAVCQQILFRNYVVFSLLNGCHLSLQLDHLAQYKLNGEVCLSSPEHVLRMTDQEDDDEVEIQLFDGPQPNPTRSNFEVLDGGRHT